MKRLCFILFFLASIVCNAQYLPVLEDGKIWHYTYYNWATGKKYKFEEKISGDTIVEGITYKKYVDQKGEVLSLLREEDGKVFSYNPVAVSHEETLLYDFTLNVGDEVSLSNIQEGMVVGMAVTDVTSISFEGKKRRSFTLSPWFYIEGEGKIVDSDLKDKWVEGMGSSGGLLVPFPSILTGNFVFLDYIELADGTVFSFDDFVGMRTLRIKEDNSLFDLSGRKLERAPQRGIYINNGKKEQVK